MIGLLGIKEARVLNNDEAVSFVVGDDADYDDNE